METIKRNALFFLALILVSCNETGNNNQINTLELSSMIDGYYNQYGEYPSSLDTFLSYFSDLDSINPTIMHLQTKQQNINWTLINKSVLEEELLVEEKGDTIFWFYGKKHLSYLDDLINGYEKDYLEYPASLEDLIDYDQATKGKKEESFDRCIVGTLMYLDKFSNQLTWHRDDSSFFLMAGSDTISCRIGPSYGVSICESDNWRDKNMFLFYNKERMIVFDENLLTKFKLGLQEIRKSYKEDQFDLSDWHFLQFTSNEGLKLFCKDDPLSLDTEWFKDVSDYLRQFTTEHELGKVIFVSAPYRKQR
jgi:hypothetical protein